MTKYRLYSPRFTALTPSQPELSAHRIDPRTGRTGVTLIEVMVALMLMAGIAGAVREVVLQLQQSSASLLRRASQATMNYNGMRELQRLVNGMKPASAGPSLSDSIDRRSPSGLMAWRDSMNFVSGCRTAVALTAQCIVRIYARPTGDASAAGDIQLGLLSQLIVESSVAGAYVVQESSEPIHFCFLLSTLNGGEWTESWMPHVELPAAVGVVIGNDTLIARTARGWQ